MGPGFQMSEREAPVVVSLFAQEAHFPAALDAPLLRWAPCSTSLASIRHEQATSSGSLPCHQDR